MGTITTPPDQPASHLIPALLYVCLLPLSSLTPQSGDREVQVQISAGHSMLGVAFGMKAGPLLECGEGGRLKQGMVGDERE